MQSRLPAHDSQRRWMVLGGLGMLVVAIGLFLYFGAEIRANERKAPKGPPAIPVTVAPVRQEMVPFRLLAIGNVEAYATVSVKARVDGQIVEVGFKEGESVPRGRTLFHIDPRPYEATLRQAEANFLRDTAQKDQARSQEQRYKDLLEKNFVSKEAYAQIRTNADTAEAVAQGSRAALDNAKLNVEYCTIRSPINGRAGQRNVDAGNVVSANSGSLLVIQRLDPIYADFTVTENELTVVQRNMSSRALKVEVRLPDDSSRPREGKLTFLDNAVQEGSGTVKLRATLSNGDRQFWPGRFAKVRLVLETRQDAVLVPADAPQLSAKGSFVYVVDGDSSAELRPVKVGQRQGDLVVIEEGVRAGERVVVNGQLGVTPGGKVRILQPSDPAKTSALADTATKS